MTFGHFCDPAMLGWLLMFILTTTVFCQTESENFTNMKELLEENMRTAVLNEKRRLSLSEGGHNPHDAMRSQLNSMLKISKDTYLVRENRSRIWDALCLIAGPAATIEGEIKYGLRDKNESSKNASGCVLGLSLINDKYEFSLNLSKSEEMMNSTENCNHTVLSFGDVHVLKSYHCWYKDALSLYSALSLNDKENVMPFNKSESLQKLERMAENLPKDRAALSYAIYGTSVIFMIVTSYLIAHFKFTKRKLCCCCFCSNLCSEQQQWFLGLT